MANHYASAVPLSPLSEASSSDNDDDDDVAAGDDQSLATSASASTFAATDLFFPSRRRRLLSRLPRWRGNGRAASTPAASTGPSPVNFNPEAPEFVPTRMPPKRKASSSARSGKSFFSAPRGNASHPTVVEWPLIRPEDIFGSDALATCNSDTFETIVDDDDHTEIFELDMSDTRPFAQDRQDHAHQRERLQRGLSWMRTEKSKHSSDSIKCRSAILVSYDRTVGVHDILDDSVQMRYLPLQAAFGTNWRGMITKHTDLAIQPSHREYIENAPKRAASGKAIWPLEKLPVEIFDLITDHLSRDDIKSMRLVCKEFEKKVSCTLFNTSVVPFNTELYDMIDEDTRAVRRVSRSIGSGPLAPPDKGKGKAKAQDQPKQGVDCMPGLLWLNAKEDAEGKVYKGHGLRVFQGFGPHIKRFGMSFEVAEGQLSRPPIKKELDHVESYFGSYDWPQQQYTRFANLAGLERTADDTLRMKSAFANLQRVQDLALAVDSGLGWLNGPDRSIRGRIFERPSPIFGHSRDVPDRQMQEAQDFWAAIHTCHRSLGVTTNPKEMTLARKPLEVSPSHLPGLQGTRYADSYSWNTIAASKALPANSANADLDDTRFGVLYTTFTHPDYKQFPLYDKSALVPSDLRKEQKEWLLETEWAQRAFLECYMLAVIDNPIIFSHVKTLKLAKISSGFLTLLARESFWDALPSLSDVTIHVKPDWRSVEKDNAGFAETCNHNPSEAVRVFHKCILRDRLCLRPSITKLNIGWVGGGEDAEGIFARNTNILPAPLTQLEHSTTVNANFGLVFQFVEHLTLTNCWITPPTLEELIKNHASRALRTLTLKSVSLTAHPRFPAGGQAAQQAALQLAAGQVAQPVPVQQAHPGQWFHLNNFHQHGQFPQQPPLAQQNAHQFAPLNWGVPLVFHHPGPITGMNQQQIVQANQHMYQQLINQHNGALFPLPPAAAPAPAPAPAIANNNNHNTIIQGNSHWSENHREGSWPDLLNNVSPGTIFTDYLPQPAPWEEQPPPRQSTNLHTIEFVSCGYAKLVNNNAFDQFRIEADHEHGLSRWFRGRQAALAPAMMSTIDRYTARIIQHMPQRELAALLFAWGLTEGWADRAKAEEAEFDGLLPGGTGRFSGRIAKDMALVGEAEER